MGSVNKVFLVGHVGRDPEMKTTQAGKALATFSLATSRRTKAKETDWHEVVAWEKVAEVVEKYVTKGKEIHIEGRLEQQSWDDKDTGKKRYRTVVVAEVVTFVGKADSGSGTQVAPVAAGAAEDDLPF